MPLRFSLIDAADACHFHDYFLMLRHDAAFAYAAISLMLPDAIDCCWRRYAATLPDYRPD